MCNERSLPLWDGCNTHTKKTNLEMDLENCHCPRFHCQNLYYHYCKSFFKTLLVKWLNFMNGVQLSQGYRASTRRQFTFYH